MKLSNFDQGYRDGAVMWVIAHGTCRLRFWTYYHADQYARALRLNGTPFTMEKNPCQKP